MGRTLVGQRIRKHRQGLGQSQSKLAAEVGISPSYLNLIEHNKRPIGGALLYRIADALSLDSTTLAGTEETRLIAELGEVAADAEAIGIDLSADTAGEVVASNPQAARAILGLYRAYREARLRSDLLGEKLGEDSFLAETSHQILALITTIRSYAEILKDYGDLSNDERQQFVSTLVGETETLTTRANDMFDFMSGRGARRPRATPREAIEDFITDNGNYFSLLEDATELTLKKLQTQSPSLESLCEFLLRRHGIRIERRPASDLPPRGARQDGTIFQLSDNLGRSSSRFLVARLIGSLECGDALDTLIVNAALATTEASAQLRNAMANYFAGALMMPYEPFRAAAADTRFDIARLGHQFDASFEQVCHRLTTLQRPGAEGLPLHFLRTDIAGNISKRFSASGLRLPRYGDACPRWIIHHAYTAPGRIVTQIGRLPDGEAFFSVARANVPQFDLSFAERHHAIMIGCSIKHANRLAYADGLDLTAMQAGVPIGITCRQCPREDCVQRAFDRAPVLGGALSTQAKSMT